MFRNPILSTYRHLAAVLSLFLMVSAGTVQGQTTTAFTYQGRLSEGGLSTNGAYEMEFKLYDTLTEGTAQPQPTPVTISFLAANANPVQVTNGVFTVQLDFGSDAFPGATRYLEIAVRRVGDMAFTVLSPRQVVTSTPYAIRSSSAAKADNATALANQLSSAGSVNNPDNPVDWSQLKNVPDPTGVTYSAGPGISIVGQTISNTGVRTVAANGPLSSSGGQNPTITLSGVVPLNRGGTGSATKNFVDLSTNQIVGGSKTFNKIIVDGGLTLTGQTQIIRYDPALVATLRWDQLASPGDFVTGHSPGAVAFDGANIWIANYQSNNLTKLRASDGALLGTFPVGLTPLALAFDGENIWAANYAGNNVTKLRASDGQQLGTFPVGQNPVDIAFDGANVWVVNSYDVTKLRASDGMNLGVIEVDSGTGITFDGTNMWIAQANFSHGDTVVKVASNGNQYFPVAGGVTDIAFDGANIWVLSGSTSSATKLRASDGTKLGTFPVGAGPNSVAFDGENIWVTSSLTDTVAKVRTRDGAKLDVVRVGRNPAGVVFDGATIWVANARSNTVSKL